MNKLTAFLGLLVLGTGAISYLLPISEGMVNSIPSAFFALIFLYLLLLFKRIGESCNSEVTEDPPGCWD